MRKRCARCKRKRPILDFSIEKSTRDGRCRWCRKCKQAQRIKAKNANIRRWKKEDPYTLRTPKKCCKCKEAKSRLNFSRCRTTSDGLTAICKTCGPLRQCRITIPADAKCEICGSLANIIRDHCHQTGCFRGFLCHRCNVGLGCFKDSAALLHKASLYAQKPATTEKYKR